MSIYGEFTSLPIRVGTLAVIGVLILLTILETLFTWLEKLAETYQTTKLFLRLKQELMLMGLISFADFLVMNGGSGDFSSQIRKSEWFLGFEVAHILFLFVALAFVVQGVFLTLYAVQKTKVYLQNSRVTASSLLYEMDELKAESRNANSKKYSGKIVLHIGILVFKTFSPLVPRVFVFQGKNRIQINWIFICETSPHRACRF